MKARYVNIGFLKIDESNFISFLIEKWLFFVRLTYTIKKSLFQIMKEAF